MNLTIPITDNVSEILVKILDFTSARERLIKKNIENAHTQGYVPRDFNVGEFSRQINYAIDEHLRNKRLVWVDSDSIKFAEQGTFKAFALVDEQAAELIKNDVDKYLEQQSNKLMEISLNKKVAKELLKQKQGLVSLFE